MYFRILVLVLLERVCSYTEALICVGTRCWRLCPRTAPSFTPPQSTSPSSPAQAQALSAAFLLVPAAAQLAYIPAVDAEGGIQDEWVALTRNLTLLSAHGAPEHESAMCGNREEIMMVRISNMNSCS